MSEKLNSISNKYLTYIAYSVIFIILMGFMIITPPFFFNQVSSGPESNVYGHIDDHTETMSDCGVVSNNPNKKVTLVAQQVLWEVAPGETFPAWSFNGTLPGPAICINQGDTLTVTLENQLSTIVSFHAHGLFREFESDGTFMSTSFAVPGGSYTYTFFADEFSVGTWAYHDAVAEMDKDPFFHNLTSPESGEGIERGLFGALIVYGNDTYEPSDIDHEIILVEAEFESEVTLGPTFMTFNGKIDPATPHFIFKSGEKIRFRIINIGPNANHNIFIEGLTLFDTLTNKNVDSVFFGALEFGDYTVEATSLLDTLYVCDIPGHTDQGMFGSFTIIS